MTDPKEIQQRAVQTIRFLAADGVQNANSGHPGLPMGTAAMAYTIWTRHLHFNPQNPQWANRDRFVLSGGHGSMLLYSLLHLTGFAVSLDDLMHFRQWGSITPGHPEVGQTPGVEVTTGPLGQGFANGVGMALAEAHLAATFNTPENPIIDHYVYAIVTDGDLMEGVTAEAASLAGHLQLGKLIYLYDDNRISIDGSTELSFTEDRGARFQAYGWQVLHVEDGNDVEALDQAIQAAKADPRPSLIICRTHIGYGLPTRQDTSKAHGEPPGDEELNAAKSRVGWPEQPRFFIPEDVLAHFRQALQRGAQWEKEWNQQFAAYKKQDPQKAAELHRRLQGELPAGWDQDLPVFPADPKGMATRAASGKVLNALAARLPELVSGSADLTPSNNTWLANTHAIQPGAYDGRYVHYGVREHAMGSILNGITLHKGIIALGGTFLVFADYNRPAIRLSALSHLPTLWLFTHDSIGLGEDGPTHQPVEQLAALRAIPNLNVIRPADANETAEAWAAAIRRRNGPTLLAFTRQNVPTLDRERFAPASGLHRGAYVLADLGDVAPQIILMASGSEVSLIIEAGEQLAAEGYGVRLVSFPSWELFDAQDSDYQKHVLPRSIEPRLAVEAGIKMGWERYTGQKGAVVSIETFGASAPAKKLFEEYGLTAANVVAQAHQLLGFIEN